MPEWVRALAPDLPAELTCSIWASLCRLLASVVGRVVVATMSMSLTESARRRAEPASFDLRALPGEGAQAVDELFADLERARQQRPRRRACAGARVELLERREHAFLELGAEPAHGAQALRERGLAQRLRRVDAELGVQQPRALRAEAGQARDRDQARRELRAQLLRRGDRAGLHQREDLFLERLADPRQLRRTALTRERADRHGRLAHGLGGAAIGEDAMHDRAVKLVQVAEFFERLRDRGVGQLWTRWLGYPGQCPVSPG